MFTHILTVLSLSISSKKWLVKRLIQHAYPQSIQVLSKFRIMFFNFLFITSLRLLFGFTAVQNCESTDDVQVFITVSSLASTNNNKTERQVELNWFNVSPQNGDWVGLFQNDPKIDIKYPLENISPLAHPLNYYRSWIQLPRFAFQTSNFKNQCIGFWIAYIRDDVILAQKCVKIQPQWMWEARDIIGNFTLSEIMIPGTHNSGSYPKGLLENVIDQSKFYQDEDIFDQFVYGIRSFDLRIGSYPSKPDEFWVNHDKTQMQPFRSILEDIKTVINSTKEIVILDFHGFPVGFTNSSTHNRFISLLIEELAQWMVPRSLKHHVLSQLWACDKRIVVMYSHQIYYEYDLLWRGLSQKWENTMDLSELKKFLEQFTHEPKSQMWAAMAELTPMILSNPRKGIRYFADIANRNVTQWFRDEWWDSGNVVATDYFHGNDIIDVAIKSNKRRRKCTKSKMIINALNELL
uniref:Phosphatidylinositol-specific phospholipase C X domain-containing protein n=1 Tax=Strigamia maritima TaxID=126957 RepID=T1JAD7_STRMM